VSQPDSTEARPGIYVPKPKPDVYTMMLVVALLALILAIVYLLLELRTYHWETKAPMARAAATSVSFGTQVTPEFARG
jgi:hypothetical protein